MKTGRKESAAVLAEHSKSFALAGRLFPPGAREDARMRNSDKLTVLVIVVIIVMILAVAVVEWTNGGSEVAGG